ncbi:hypothetical protein [Actinacidiphila glaucinigra]|uniref:hypothetical protein n=1 Tax=Actinacidiphila glaucinigra TaxID=235986 RepID=UPI003D8F3FCA
MPAHVPSQVTVAIAPRRPAGSRIRHGQASCADYGCTLPACREAARRARRRRKRDHAAGLTTKVDPTAAAGHASLLRRHGMSAQDLADASGFSVTLIRRLLRPPAIRPKQIARTTADAVLGIAIPSRSTWSSVSGQGLTPAGQAATLLVTLAQAGWPASYMAPRLGTRTQTLAAIRNQKRSRIRIALDQSIRRLYARLLSPPRPRPVCGPQTPRVPVPTTCPDNTTSP